MGDPKEKYASQIAQLKEMGFLDESTLIQVLKQTNGNVNMALEILFSQLGDK